MSLTINDRLLGIQHPSYFIADIAANHDGDLDRACRLIEIAKEAGADAVKFQNFRAPDIVSDTGFNALGDQLSHQSKWKKSVFEVYADASIPWEWTPKLCDHAKEVGIDYFSAPYDLGAIDMLDPYVPAFKVGSGDITWLESIEHMAKKGKPVLLATGASDLRDVVHAVEAALAHNPQLVLMQCNTNYTGSLENFRYIQLNVLKTYATLYPDLVLGLSDHTPGHATVLGALALGARVFEKHFTDDTSREGPDHGFSMTSQAWREMVDRSRELEYALGSGVKRVEGNEQDTVVLQRRGLRAAKDLAEGEILKREDILILRPAQGETIKPNQLDKVVGRKTQCAVAKDSPLTWSMFI